MIMYCIPLSVHSKERQRERRKRREFQVYEAYSRRLLSGEAATPGELLTQAYSRKEEE